MTTNPVKSHQMTDSADRIRENVATLRARADLSQADLAALAGLSRSALSEKLSGRTGWSLADLDALADALGVSITELVGEPPCRSVWFQRRSSTG